MTASAAATDDAWSTAVPDWAERIMQGRSLLPDLPLHDAYADKALTIFKDLVNPDQPGFPTYGDICEQWIFDYVRAIFGSYDPQAKVRYLRDFFVMIPKKNGKTALAAAIIVTATVLNESPEAQFVLIAPTTKLAQHAFGQCKGIIARTPRTAAVFARPQEQQKTIRYLNPDCPSKIIILAADADVVTGLKNATVLVDETHVFANKAAAMGIFGEIRGAMSHPNNKHFFLQITTQSKTRPTGVFRAELTTARNVRDGKLRRPMLPLIYELPAEVAEDNGWQDPDTWALVNPHMGKSLDRGYLEDALNKAIDEGPEAMALVASQNFNVEIGTAQGDDGWTAQRYWDSAADPGLTLEALLARSDVCTIGVDGGGDDDLCGLVVLGRERETRRLLAWCHAWAQPEVLTRRKSIAPALKDFARDGDLTICKSAFQHVEDVVGIVGKCLASGRLPAEEGVGIDQAGLPELQVELTRAGYGPPLTTGVPQGWQLQTAIKSLPLRLKAGIMAHGGQPLFGWSVGNAKVEIVRSNLYMTKAQAGVAKIDVVIALLNAAMLMYRDPEAAGAHVTPWDADPEFRIAV